MNAGRWPYPGDSPLARARKVAHMYRAALGAANAAMRDQCDRTAVGYGETWAIPRLITHNDDDLLNPADAADYLCTTLANIRRLRLAGRLVGHRTDDGWRYRVADLRILQEGRPRTRRPGTVGEAEA